MSGSERRKERQREGGRCAASIDVSKSLCLSLSISLRCVFNVCSKFSESSRLVCCAARSAALLLLTAAATRKERCAGSVRTRARVYSRPPRPRSTRALPSSPDFRSPPAARVRSYHILECTAHAIDRPIDRSMIGLSAVRLQRLDSRECRERKRAVSPLYCCCCCLYCAAACLSDRKLRFRLLTRPISGASARSPW